MTDWHLSHGSYSFRNYRVISQGKRWLARKTRSHSFPEHLGAYDSPGEAMSACMDDYRGYVEVEQD
jgi:hypothetical protein